MNANDFLRHHTCSDEFYKYQSGLMVTEGVKALADEWKCYWLLDIIASYYPELKNEEFQVWKLSVYEDNSALVICTDGNSRVLKQQQVPFTDFKGSEATVWVEGNVMLLPSEH